MVNQRASLKWDVRLYKDVSTSIVNVQDFLRTSCQVMPIDISGDHRLIPYCFDFSAQESVYCVDIDPLAAQQAVFHYEYLRGHVRQIITVPWENDRRSGLHMSPPPIFLFSPGRCGSTLLNNMVEAVAAWGISEPDFLTQAIVECARRQQSNFQSDVVMDMMQRLLLDLTKPYVRAKNRPVIIKMRSQANVFPGAIYPTTQYKYKSIFLIRHFVPWAISMVRTFDISLHHLVPKYIEALQCYKFLQSNTECLLFRYEDLTTDNPIVFKILARHVGSVPPEKHGFDFSKNAQDGSIVKTKRDMGTMFPESLNVINKMWLELVPQIKAEHPEFGYEIDG